MLQFGDMGVQGGRHGSRHEGGHLDKVADMVAEMEVNKVANISCSNLVTRLVNNWAHTFLA